MIATGRRRTGAGGALLELCLLVVLASACTLFEDRGRPEEAGTPGAPGASASGSSPEEALRRYVERRLNLGFVPDCEDARRPEDVGKQCARFRGERQGLRAYELGPTFSTYTRLVILRRAGDAWTIEHLENRDPNEPPVPGIPWPLDIGASVIVAGTGDCLKLRDRPGLLAHEIDCLEDGTAVTIAAGPVEIDGLEWWQIEGYEGWVAGNWLRYPEEAGAGSAPE